MKAKFPNPIYYRSLKTSLTVPVFSDHMSYVTLFQCSLGRSHLIGMTVPVFNRVLLLTVGKSPMEEFLVETSLNPIHIPVKLICK
jgi:hypothetical protein